MASIKYLKKEIDYLASSVISDCLTASYYVGSDIDDEVSALVNDIVSARNDARAKVCDGKRVEQKGRKAFYTQISKDILAKTDECFTKLSELVKKHESK